MVRLFRRHGLPYGPLLAQSASRGAAGGDAQESARNWGLDRCRGCAAYCVLAAVAVYRCGPGTMRTEHGA
jgi:hypothetical protein